MLSVRDPGALGTRVCPVLGCTRGLDLPGVPMYPSPGLTRGPGIPRAPGVL